MLALIDVLTEFRSLQIALVRELKSAQPAGVDWDYLIGLPKHGDIVVACEKWEFHVHGVGVTFVEPLSGRKMNCHVGIRDHAGAFDAGRIFEFLHSIGQTVVCIDRNMVTFDFSEGAAILSQLCNRKLVKRCDNLPGQHYELPQLRRDEDGNRPLGRR